MIKLIRKLFGIKAKADDEADRNAFRDWLREEGEWIRQREADGYRLMYVPGSTDYYGNHETILLWRKQWDKPHIASVADLKHPANAAMNVHGLYWKPVPSQPQNQLAC